MKYNLSRRAFILQMLLGLAACATEEKLFKQSFELVIGVISYGEGKQTVERLNGFRDYLSKELRTIIQIETAYNERIAIERMKRNSWSLIFAPPGLAALAIANYQYSAILPLQLTTNSNSIIFVRADSSLKKLKDLQNKTVALGQKGSAAGYYFPLFNLYGLTLESILFAANPKISLEWVSQGKADAAAVSQQEFNMYKSQFSSSQFRILLNDSHIVPSGAVLTSSKVDRTQVELIKKYMKNASPPVIQQARYLPDSSPPDYKYMIGVVKRVNAIAKNLNSKPVRLFN